MTRKNKEPEGDQTQDFQVVRDETVESLEKLAKGELVKPAYSSNRTRQTGKDRAHAVIDLKVKRHM